MSATQQTLALRDPQDIDTSAMAARIDRNSMRQRVLDVLRANPQGLTDWEITELAGYQPADKPSCGKRREEVGAVIVRDFHGKPVTRLSPKGSPCKCWALPVYEATEAHGG